VAIVIRKVEDGYLGQVSPPDGHDWCSPSPSALDEIRAQLRELGCHPNGIADALDAADRTWRNRQRTRFTHGGNQGA